MRETCGSDLGSQGKALDVDGAVDGTVSSQEHERPSAIIMGCLSQWKMGRICMIRCCHCMIRSMNTVCLDVYD